MQAQTASTTRTKPAEPRYFEDVTIGDDVGDLQKGPFTTPHLMRWSAAIENFHKIHYDRDFAQQHDKLPDLLVNGSLKQNFLLQIAKDWATHHGWPWKVSYQFRAMDVVDTTLFVWGRVVRKLKLPDYGIVELELGIRNQDGRQSTPSTALIALPFRNGSPVPYPFVPPTAEAMAAAEADANRA